VEPKEAFYLINYISMRVEYLGHFKHFYDAQTELAGTDKAGEFLITETVLRHILVSGVEVN
jgi:hypothetical protein